MTKVALSGLKPITPEDESPTPKRLPDGQHADHWVAPVEDRTFHLHPVRTSYVHLRCANVTKMPDAIAETMAADPNFYGSTFCCDCHNYFQLSEFVWEGTDERLP